MKYKDYILTIILTLCMMPSAYGVWPFDKTTKQTTTTVKQVPASTNGKAVAANGVKKTQTTTQTKTNGKHWWNLWKFWEKK